MSTYNLRQITDALWKTGQKPEEQAESERLYDRARMLRDRGLIQSSRITWQGKTMMFTEPDVVAAVLAITASLNGSSWGTIQALNQDLRKVGNTLGKPEFERVINDIRDGVELFVRLDIFSNPWPGTQAIIGDSSSVSFDEWPRPAGTTEVKLWPITDIAKPVLDYLSEQAA